jgi:transcription termination/antitermination protein NusA
VKLSQVIEELVEERGLDRAVLSAIICDGLLAAYMKKYPDLELAVNYDKNSDELLITVAKKVVQTVEDDLGELSLRKARAINKDAEIGDTIIMPFEGPIGRIEILKSKQIIAQKIRAIEHAAVYEEFKPKEGTIIHGVIHKADRHGVTVKVGDALAFLPRSLEIPGDKSIVGYSIRALLKEVLTEPRNENQLILDRSSAEFLKQLFELEVPEIFEKLVEIKRIVRAPGYKSKIVVVSHDANIDPVGTCVGVGGARIKPILRELAQEKIDIIQETDSLNDFIVQSLKPAEVNRVEILGNGTANVWVDEDQRSVAIGKMGKNIALASQLTGVQIHLVKSEGPKEEDLFISDEGANETDKEQTIEE